MWRCAWFPAHPSALLPMPSSPSTDLGGGSWGGVDTQGPRGVDSHLEAPGTREAPMGWGWGGGEGRGQEARHLGQSPAQLACF